MSKTLKDLCFLTGVVLPHLALILYFVVQNEEHKKAFFQSMFYGIVLWVVLGVAIGLGMFEPSVFGPTTN
ncbi:MAG: hypothetical protein K2L52_05670 [Clostridia bacterium]|nr:hypothetical protein [Clostridia bacterium]